MKLQRVLAGSLIAAAGALSSAAFAQGYIGASIGQSDYKVDCTEMTTCDTKGTGYKLFGGYMFTRNLGIEGGWVDLGKAKATLDPSGAPPPPPVEGVASIKGGPMRRGSGMMTPPAEDIVLVPLSGVAELKASGPFLAGIAVAPIGSGSVFGKVGIANLKSELSVTVAGFTDSTSTRHTDVFYGIGAGYNFTKNFGMRAEWERFRIKYSDGVEEFKDNVDLLSVGVVYRF